jgi:hypothetical protein
MTHPTTMLDQQDESHRAHLRAINTARQAAERRKDALRGAAPELRREADAAYRAEMHRLDAEHRLWLQSQSG